MPTKLPNSYYVTHFFHNLLSISDTNWRFCSASRCSKPKKLPSINETVPNRRTCWLGSRWLFLPTLRSEGLTAYSDVTFFFFFLQGKSSRSTPDGFWLWDKFWDDILEDQSILIIFHEVIDEEDRNKCNFLVTSCSGWRWAFQSSSSWPIFALF